MAKQMTKNEFLKKMKKAQDNANEFAQLPYASYLCIIERVFQKEYKGKQKVVFVYKVIEGTQRGKKHWEFHNYEHEVGFNILIQACMTLGYPMDTISSPEELIELWTQIGQDRLHVMINISPNSDPAFANFPNTRIEEVVEMQSEEAPVVDTVVSDAKPEAESEAAVEESNVVEAEVVTESEAAVEVEVETETETETETEEETFLDIGDIIDFKFKGKLFKKGKIESSSDDGLTCVIVCGGKKYKVKTENIIEDKKK